MIRRNNNAPFSQRQLRVGELIKQSLGQIFLKDEAKINSKLIEQYYTANPPYMSVSGLLRYWDKKK